MNSAKFFRTPIFLIIYLRTAVSVMEKYVFVGIIAFALFCLFYLVESSPNFVSNINPLHPGVVFLYPLRTSESL